MGAGKSIQSGGVFDTGWEGRGQTSCRHVGRLEGLLATKPRLHVGEYGYDADAVKVLPFNIGYGAFQFHVTRLVGSRELILNAPRC